MSSHPSVYFFLLRSVCLSSSDPIASIGHGFRVDSRNLQIAVHSTVVSTQLQPGHFCELVQNHACLSTAPIHDHATLFLCMSHLDVRTCECLSGDDQVCHICDVPRHNKWFTISKSISNLSLTNTFHATSSGVAQDWQICRSRQ